MCLIVGVASLQGLLAYSFVTMLASGIYCVCANMQIFRKLNMAASKYEEWKSSHNPGHKPWRYPEQNTLKLVRVCVCVVVISTVEGG